MKKSLPSRGAWIEIGVLQLLEQPNPSLPSRGAWIEMSRTKPSHCQCGSLPSRGAWIEIRISATIRELFSVAPLTGSVD